MKVRLGLGRWHRLAYNLLAMVHLALVVALGHWLFGLETLGLPVWAATALTGLHVLGWIVMLASLRFYDLGRFSGMAQLRGAGEDEALRLDGPHRWVRHPLYFGGVMILWGAAQTTLGLATAVWGCLYLAIGAWFEERKLLRLYGEPYAAYRRKVPALLPWRGRAI